MFHKALTDIFPDPPADLDPEALDEARVPEHIAVIMDGNGRWVKKRALNRLRGHKAGIEAVRDAIPGTVLKVIIESAALSDAAIVLACQASAAAQADFVKTSTGFHPAGGASTHAVKLMRETVGDELGVKASGGIRTAKDALAMIEAGASRLGLSSSAKILEEL